MIKTKKSRKEKKVKLLNQSKNISVDGRHLSHKWHFVVTVLMWLCLKRREHLADDGKETEKERNAKKKIGGKRVLQSHKKGMWE